MSFWTCCDWCGETLHPLEDDIAKFEVTIGHPGTGKLDRRWDEEVRQTRHFCAAPKGSDQRDTCFGKAIATITGTKTTPPNMGLEWQLVTIGQEATPAPTSTKEPPDRVYGDEYRTRTAAANGDGGIGHLPLSHATYRYLIYGNLLTIDRVDVAVKDGSIAKVKGIGPARAWEIYDAIDRYRSEQKDGVR